MYTVFALKWFMAAVFLMSLNFLFMPGTFTCDNGMTNAE
jgi:hypothetical protein